jgi:hypothetical protein
MKPLGTSIIDRMTRRLLVHKRSPARGVIQHSMPRVGAMDMLMDAVMPPSMDALMAGALALVPPKRSGGLGIRHFALLRSSLWGLALSQFFALNLA